MSSTISGNVGGATASGAQVQCRTVSSGTEASGIIRFAAADGSGVYSFAGLPAGTFVISAFLASFVYYHPKQVVADGSSTYSDVNLNPTALNVANAAGNF